MVTSIRGNGPLTPPEDSGLKLSQQIQNSLNAYIKIITQLDSSNDVTQEFGKMTIELENLAKMAMQEKGGSALIKNLNQIGKDLDTILNHKFSDSSLDKDLSLLEASKNQPKDLEKIIALYGRYPEGKEALVKELYSFLQLLKKPI